MIKKFFVLFMFFVFIGAGCIRKAPPKASLQAAYGPITTSTVSCPPSVSPSSTTATSWLSDTSAWNKLEVGSLGFSLLYPTFPSEYGIINGVFFNRFDTRLSKYTVGTILELSVAGIDVKVESIDFLFLGTILHGDPIKPNKVDFSKSEQELVALLSGKYTKSITVKKVTVDNKPAVRVDEVTFTETGEDRKMYYIVPKYNRGKTLNLTLSTFLDPEQEHSELLEQIIKTVRFGNI